MSLASRRALLSVATASVVRTAWATPGQRPADFTLRAVAGTAWRGTFRLAEHLGRRPVVLAFFATWCRPCEVELPLLQRQRARFPEAALALAAIAIDGPETAAQIAGVARRHGLAFPVLHDADSSVSSRLNPQRSVPFLLAIDRRGRVTRERAGFGPEHERTLPAEIEELVRAP
jgi:cytochrome c biogenesis protein CcmG/thiol:disulfide interchange protein DsbE